MKLIIVESPAKCETIQRYLGKDYIVKASLGHVRDLATSGKGGLGVDVDNGFAPAYKINKDKQHVVNELKELARKADEVILATDPDREGEAIAWHLANVLNLNIATNKRLEFHEITRDSITTALANPRTINLNLVSSQETRRILDRIIGFKLSTLLNNRIKSKSAGRVQSATLKLIDDHDKEIKAFVPEEYWNILVNINFGNKVFDISFIGKDGVKDIKNGDDANRIISEIPEKIKVVDVTRTVRVQESKEPLTTSTMQQEAFAKLKFKTKKTQFIAQELYEGIDMVKEITSNNTVIKQPVQRVLIPVETSVAKADVQIEQTRFNYNTLLNKPKINGITIIGDKSGADYGLTNISVFNKEVLERIEADEDLQRQIDDIEIRADVIDVIFKDTDLPNYPTEHLTKDDVIIVLDDTSHEDYLSYYRWTITEESSSWVYIASDESGYTKAQIDALLKAITDRLDTAEDNIEQLQINVENLNTGLTNEINRATGEEQRIEGKVDAEAQTRGEEIERVEGLINAEAQTLQEPASSFSRACLCAWLA